MVSLCTCLFEYQIILHPVEFVASSPCHAIVLRCISSTQVIRFTGKKIFSNEGRRKKQHKYKNYQVCNTL